ncbi:unnamed protein product [Calypogeia fissa]
MTGWQWETAVAGAVAGLTTVVVLHPLDIVRTRFQVSDGRNSRIPNYRSTAHALATITKTEGIRGLYAGLFPSVLGSSISWGLYFFFYGNAKARYERVVKRDLGPLHHLLAAAEAGSLVCVITNPLWLVKTRLQLQPPAHGARKPYAGLSDALRSIVKEEGWRGLYKGLGPSLVLVSHGALQFMAYEEGKKMALALRSRRRAESSNEEVSLASADYALLGAGSKLFAGLLTYPYQVIRARIQQRPNVHGVANYTGGWQAFKTTLRYEGVPGLYRGIVPNLLRTVPSSSLTFLVYETTLKLLK